MARRRSVRRSTRPRRRYEWARSAGQFGTLPSDKAHIVDLMDDFQTVLGADAAGVTVTRIRGDIKYVYVAGAQTVLNTATLTGIRVDEDQVTGLTDAQELEKVQQRYADWMYYSQDNVSPAAAEGVTTTVSEDHVLRQHIDIKSQRRFDELQQSLFLYLACPTADTDDTVNFYWNLNILLKMP